MYTDDTFDYRLMGLFSLYSNKKNDGKDGIAGSGGNPDDRPRPRVLHPDDEDDSSHASSRHKSGVITKGEFENHSLRRLREKLGARRASMVEAVVHPSIEEAGAHRGMRPDELDETMEALTEDHLKLGLSEKNLNDTRAILEKEL